MRKFGGNYYGSIIFIWRSSDTLIRQFESQVNATSLTILPWTSNNFNELSLFKSYKKIVPRLLPTAKNSFYSL